MVTRTLMPVSRSNGSSHALFTASWNDPPKPAQTTSFEPRARAARGRAGTAAAPARPAAVAVRNVRLFIRSMCPLPSSSGGTLFLDEIDALPLTLQGKLLAALEGRRVRRLGAVADRPVDVKLIAATRAAPSERVAAGRFRLRQEERLERLRDPVLAGPCYFTLSRGYNWLGDHGGSSRCARRAIAEAVRCGDDATKGKAPVLLVLLGHLS